jgi:D-alanine-D-alanine ligase
MKQRIVILYGGKSGEHEVSLQSAASVLKNLDRNRYDVALVGITADGRWYVQPERLSAAPPYEIPHALPITESDSKRVHAIPEGGLSCPEVPIPADCVFPVLHGPFGEDGTVQGLLEVAGIPYVGAGVLGSALGMDKEACKRAWREAGLPVVDFLLLHRHAYEADPEAERDRVLRDVSLPLFVKPSRVGSSVGISRVKEPDALTGALQEAFTFDTKVLVERAVSGRELECSVVGNHSPRAFPLGEIIPRHEFYTYEAKYIDPDGAGLQVPAQIEEPLAREIQDYAVRAYRAADVQGMARVDFFLDNRGKPLLNEINTIPGFTRISMFPMLCSEGDLPYSQLLDTLISGALERHRERSALRNSYQWS